MFCRRWTLIVKFLVLRICLVVRSGDIPVVTNISEDTTWVPEDTYLLNQQIQVLPNVTLTILPGVMVKAGNLQGSSAALIISQGARILAEGTADKPITFTTQFSTVNTKRGLWGGLVICGYGILAKGPGTSRFLEGFENIIYGGSDEEDYSGILKYVRIWHGGGDLSGDQHINGLTLAGVGSKTIIEHVEVAWSDDDGFEFFGGSVNAKWISSIFNADDAIDTDDGYSGRMQFVFSIVDKDGDHAMELDSNSFDGETNTQPRAFPQIYGATIIRTEKAANDDPLITFRTGTGGRFGNMILRGGQDDSMNALVANPGFSNTNFCGNQSRFSNLSDTLATQLGLDYLFFSQNNIIYTPNLQATETGDYPFDISCSSTDSWTPLATIVDPLFVLLPKSWDAYTIDPRPREESPAYIDLDKLPHGDDFFTQTTYKGAFGDDLWIAGWSYLTSAGLLPDKSVTSVGKTILEGNITSDTTLDDDSRQYYLIGPLYVKSGATLTIPSGTTIRASRQSSEGKTPCVIIENGAQLVAIGDEASPITFTTVLSAIDLSTPGLWGGIAILGKAISSIRHSSRLLPGGSVGNFGNFDDNDKSGTLRYVRVWYAGSTKLDNTEGDGFGVMLGGVGNKTIVEYVEVAFSGKDGFVFDGGSVNARYLSVVSQNEDAFDISNGYVGKLQFIAALLDENGEKAANIKSNGTLQRRTSPQISGATFMKSKHRSSSTELMRVSKGAGGEYTNIILTGFSGVCLSQIECADESRNTGPNLPSEGVVGTYYWSSKNIVNCIGPTTLQVNQFELDSSCSAQNFSPESRFGDGAQLLQLLPIDNIEWFSLDTVFQLDPRPAVASEALKQYDTLLDPFFDAVTFVGAFGTNLWLHQWSILSTRAYIPDRDVQLNENNTLSSTISTDTTLSGSRIWYLTTQVFVLSGATLTIPAGTTIRAYRQESDGKAPSLIIKQGAKIIASGTSLSPITFTSVLPSFVLPRRGTWGGIILLGNAIITGNQTMKIEGLSSGDVYGGLDDSDDSGTLRYVRVWYGGADIGFDPTNPENSGNEINGITFGGVGSGTTLEHCEVAFNKDDGFEFFGGSVNGKWLSALFVDDDAFDTDEGYIGKLQFIFALVDADGDHAAEMDSKDDGTRRSMPTVSGATFIKADHTSGYGNGMIQIREGGGGEFYNMVLSGFAGSGLQNNDCASETKTDDPSSIPNSDYLYWSPNNIHGVSRADTGVTNAFDLSSDCVWTPNNPPSARTDDPSLVFVPSFTTFDTLVFIDPRPQSDGPVFSAVDDAPDSFFDQVDYLGAFGSNQWLDQWSYLSVSQLLPASGALPGSSNILSGDISSDTTLGSGNTYYLTGQTFVTDGTTLTIQAGTTIRAYPVGADGKAPALVIEQGAKIEAAGTASSPITFTSALPDRLLPQRGLWGGLIILGKGIITTSSGSSTSTIEGLDGVRGTYGGSDDSDSSGTLQYVRVWYGGADIAPDPTNPENSGNEINGITFGGVGNGTTVDHCEVAFNLDDGFEFFGGSVNAKYLSTLFVQDDAFDTDEGYQGSLQYLFALVDQDGDHAAEMDSKDDNNRRSFPTVSGVTFIKSDHSSGTSNGLVQIREGGGGEFRNVILTGKAGAGLENNECFSEVRTSTEASIGTAPDYLYWDPLNIINTVTSNDGTMTQFKIATGSPDNCIWTSNDPQSRDVDPNLVLLPSQWTTYADLGMIDPRPAFDSVAFSTFDSTVPKAFFTTPTFTGAFGQELWLDQWSWLSVNGLIPESAVYPDSSNTLCGEITSDTTLSALTDYVMTCQLFVKSPAVLTIEAGTTIRSYKINDLGTAPALVIEQGAQLIAQGTNTLPITFTNVLPEQANPARGTWGGLILLGSAPISKSGGTNDVEGLPPGLGTYGGTNAVDNSGILTYVRVWYGGADIGADSDNPENSGNEINGITFAGVGSSTLVEHCEVAYNKDDGFEFFGGTVNVKWLSSIFNQDDAFDTDEGYQGNMQFLFALVDTDGNHATEMDSRTDGNLDSQPRSFPQVYGATFIKAGHTTTDGLMRLREGTGGRFGNIILTGNAAYGLQNTDCGSETRSGTNEGTTNGNTLFFSDNNIVYTQNDRGINVASLTDTSCSTWTPAGPNPLVVDPQLILLPASWETSVRQIDPRPIDQGNSYGTVDTPPADETDFFATTNYVGAFGADLWIDGWSWLSVNALLPANSAYPTVSTTLCGNIETSQTLSSTNTYFMTCPVFVKSPSILTIEAGTTIRSYLEDVDGNAPVLVVEKGAKIIADGTADLPITFTTVLPDSVLPRRGLWGGVIILGEARISTEGGTNTIEGLSAPDGQYGGTDDSDDSGSLTYVRIWYGGADINPDPLNPENSGNEINGLTLGGVGSGTDISYCEVAFNVDDGFEFFGGNVDVSYLSSVFNGDDQFDMDEGYRGKMEYLFGLTGGVGNHAIECDSKTNSDLDADPRTRVEISHSTFIGDPFDTDAVLRFREGSSGILMSSVVSGKFVGIERKDCSVSTQQDADTSTLPDSASVPEAFYFDPSNVVDAPQQFKYDSSCGDSSSVRANSSLDIRLLPDTPTESSAMFDPRPNVEGALQKPVDAWLTRSFAGTLPFTKNAFDTSTVIGAFDSSTSGLWVHGWTYLFEAKKLPGVDDFSNDADRLLCGEITTDTTLSSGIYYLTCQVFVTNMAVLTINPGVTIKSYSIDASGTAPALIITQGSQIMAKGTSNSKITFTSVRDESTLPDSGTWGGLIILGNAPISGGGTRNIEGLDENNNSLYGGSDSADNSGTLEYVRVWYGGADIDAGGFENSGNEINGITFGGVGSGTTVSFCEVAYNLDDGFEFFGGSVNVKYLSSIFNGDDAFDTDQGYQGKMQFLFCMVGQNGHHCTEMDSKTGGDVNSQPRSFPQLYGATFLGGAPDNQGGNDAVMRLREGTGGRFGNLIVSNAATIGMKNNECGAETRSDTNVGSLDDTLFFSSQNILWSAGNSGFQQFSTDSSCTWSSGPSAFDVDPAFYNVPFDTDESSVTVQFDPRVDPCGAGYENVTTPFEESGSFFETTTYKGAFGSYLWLKDISQLFDTASISDINVVPGVCLTDDGSSSVSSVGGTLTFTNVDCTSDAAQQLAADAKTQLAAYANVPETQVETRAACGSTVIDFTVSTSDATVANNMDALLSSNPSAVLGSVVSTYGIPAVVTQVQTDTDINIVTTNFPTPAPTPAPVSSSTSSSSDDNSSVETERNGFIGAFVIVTAILIGVIAVFYCRGSGNSYGKGGPVLEDQKLQNLDEESHVVEGVSMSQDSRADNGGQAIV
mmetsp:Transcript_6079/g.9260  ORF Transcript_6079/g.9260 Transcript_6079/m.9260 type:complete len:3282 (-) Transcript_6079:228-10073(-)